MNGCVNEWAEVCVCKYAHPPSTENLLKDVPEGRDKNKHTHICCDLVLSVLFSLSFSCLPSYLSVIFSHFPSLSSGMFGCRHAKQGPSCKRGPLVTRADESHKSGLRVETKRRTRGLSGSHFARVPHDSETTTALLLIALFIQLSILLVYNKLF